MDKDFWARLQRAIKTAQRAKGGYAPPAAGLAYARFVGYFEAGKHKELLHGKLAALDKVELVFELSGPNHRPRKLDDGTLIPYRITVQETLVSDYRANFPKLFSMMNEAHGGFATHMAELLTRPFLVEVFHRLSGDGTKVYAGLRDSWGYNIQGVTYQDDETGETKTLDVAPAITEPRYFIWEAADKAMWDSIYIPGFYGERKDDKGKVVAPARSKNVLQERIMAATNWPELAERLGISPAS